MIGDFFFIIGKLKIVTARYSEEYGLHMNTTKTKLMVFSKKFLPANLYIKGQLVNQVSTYKYLGCNINDQCDPKKEI